jgi:cytochrome b involved in lipid metabolism
MSTHPGGQQVIGLNSGSDATRSFTYAHRQYNNANEVDALLARFLIGRYSVSFKIHQMANLLKLLSFVKAKPVLKAAPQFSAIYEKLVQYAFQVVQEQNIFGNNSIILYRVIDDSNTVSAFFHHY